MTLNQYLNGLLGEKEAKKLRTALKLGKTIIVDGPQGPVGKTALVRILQKHGYPAEEKWMTHEITLNKPLAEFNKDIVSEVI